MSGPELKNGAERQIVDAYLKLHEGKIGAHWIWCAIEQINAGIPETEVMRDYGYSAAEPSQRGSADLFRSALMDIKYKAVSLADAQVVALRALNGFNSDYSRAAPTPAEPAKTEASYYNEIFRAIQAATKIEGGTGIGVSVQAFKDELARRGCVVRFTPPTPPSGEGEA